ncbi:hypothetical protein JQM97_03370 [Prevotella hominis]|uniref:hypothetical protein n=1 Tax=Segatella hominis TaxID=2518605 RepID=UPI001F2F37D5|nr:hypothetical protein [Segatella hominis]MCF2589998.1 hypothetical protein [Segatella hominis]
MPPRNFFGEVVRPKREKASVTQNGAGNAWMYNSGANNNNKTNSNFVLPVFDYHILMMPYSSRHPSIITNIQLSSYHARVCLYRGY